MQVDNDNVLEYVEGILHQCDTGNIRIPKEMFEWLGVVIAGAKKHGGNNWLEPDGGKSSHVDMHMSMLRHFTASFSGVRFDADSGFPHLLLLATRAIMLYTRQELSIKHPEDK